MADRELLVRIVGDDRDLQKTLSSTDRKLESIDKRTQTFGRNVGRAFAAAGITVGTAAIFQGISAAVSAASDLEEQLSKSNVVFGESSQEVERWSETTAAAFGISQRAALEAAGSIGTLLKVVGFAPDELAAMSEGLVELAGDLASFNDSNPEDVLTALRSGLVGEVEPLRRYGVLLSEARVQQVALEQSGKANVKALSDQEKALARFNIIMQDTVLAQGDAERTSDSLAGQSRRLRANYDNLAANLGGVLVPILADATEAANLLFEALDQMRGVDFSPGFDFPDPPEWLRGAALAPISPLGAGVVVASQLFGDDNEKIKGLTALGRAVNESLGGLIAVMEQRAESLRKANRAAEAREADAFKEKLLGLGLKLDRAGLTNDLTNDLAVLREIERAIQRRIEAEGRTFALMQRLTEVQLQIARTVEQQQADAERKREEAIANAAEKREAAARRRRDRERRRMERRRAQQFEVLGLTADGQERAPTLAALRSRGQKLEDQIKGTTLDTKRNRTILEEAARVLSGQFKGVGREVRLAIEQMFNEIAAGLEGGDKTLGPLTKTSGLNTKKILAGLGLSDEQINELRGRLSSVNSAGQQLAGLGPAPGGGTRIREGGFGNNPIFVENYVTVAVDGKQFTGVVTKEQQKVKRRNPQQKRGPNRNR